MTSRALRRAALWSMTLLAVACASPNPRFYTLNSSSSSSAAVTATSGLSVAVGPVTVPVLVDRPQFVLGVGANQVQIDELSRWASPLADNISRVIQAELAQQLGTTRVWAQSLIGQPTPDLRVTIDVQRFDTVPGEAVVIDVFWSVQRTAGGAAKTGRSLVREPSPAPGIEPTVAAHSRALARVSADIAGAIRSL